jgi:hypothetical protein
MERKVFAYIVPACLITGVTKEYWEKALATVSCGLATQKTATWAQLGSGLSLKTSRSAT